MDAMTATFIFQGLIRLVDWGSSGMDYEPLMSGSRTWPSGRRSSFSSSLLRCTYPIRDLALEGSPGARPETGPDLPSGAVTGDYLYHPGTGRPHRAQWRLEGLASYFWNLPHG
jgi:hypothetical protein